ncbi:hypothetical protein B6N60_02740 [Richelia sinica FACHB-800]|uniref:Uncharacterized protein n=1 Tax=Richelia sinica FACHB-800 TaxID=1357546 RepID=A0A975T8D2_9NOST|nr:hypothetical protein [Richelia sinica]MBD2667204.1 hypothetical protein [Richelia sinica FACHB-800]QXE24037.1 hypothetical protein B6N60_02740 [Richelia sinica FACHB-800]
MNKRNVGINTKKTQNSGSSVPSSTSMLDGSNYGYISQKTAMATHTT